MDITRKYWYVSGFHLDNPPLSMNYASFVIRGIVCISLLVAALKDIKIMVGDIQNAYLNAQTKENFFYAGVEWKLDQGRPVIVVRSL